MKKMINDLSGRKKRELLDYLFKPFFNFMNILAYVYDGMVLFRSVPSMKASDVI